MSSAFNPEAFLSTNMDKPLEKRDALPTSNPEASDGCYIGVVRDVKSRVWEGKTEKTAGRSGVAVDVTLDVDVPASLQTTQGGPKRVLSDSIMLDLTEAGQIDSGKGKNSRLRMYREATNLNNPGDSFSFLKMVGRPIKFKLEHEMWNDTVQERIKQVLRP